VAICLKGDGKVKKWPKSFLLSQAVDLVARWKKTKKPQNMAKKFHKGLTFSKLEKLRQGE
jgi:hypothetical protein